MTPIELNFYNKQWEIEKTFIKTRITWGDYKEIMIAQEEMSGKSESAIIDRISDYVVLFFEGQFPKNSLEKKATQEDVAACFYNILYQCNEAISSVDFRKGTPNPSPTTTQNH